MVPPTLWTGARACVPAWFCCPLEASVLREVCFAAELLWLVVAEVGRAHVEDAVEALGFNE